MLMVALSSAVIVIYGSHSAQLAALEGYKGKERVIRNVCYLIAELLILIYLSKYLIYASLIPFGATLSLLWFLTSIVLVALHSYKMFVKK